MGTTTLVFPTFRHKKVETMGRYIQICLAHNPGLVLTAQGHSDGDHIVLKPDVNAPNQIFEMKQDDGWCTFRLSQHDSKCLDFDERHNYLQVYRHKHLGNKNQKWRLEDHGPFKFIMTKEDKSDRYCFTAEPAAGRVMVRKWMGGLEHQQFKIKEVMH